MNRDKIIEEYQAIVATDSEKARKLIKKLNYKNDHYLLQLIAQTYYDESLFELDGSIREYVEKRKWRLAEKYTIKAWNINADCPLVLYMMGKVRKLNGQKDIAIYCYQKIIKLGIKGFLKEECRLSRSFIWELVNDSKFELYRLFYDEDPVLSKRYLSMYKKGLEKGIETIYRPLEKFLLD